MKKVSLSLEQLAVDEARTARTPATTLAAQPDSQFTLVYCNQRSNTIMFNEALQDLKDRYPARVTLIHLLSRQPQEVAMLHGRLDEAKVAELLGTLIPPANIDEAFICGPEAMIEGTERALKAAGVASGRIHAERFVPPGGPAPAHRARPATATAAAKAHRLDVVIDGKTHHLSMAADDHVLDAALDAFCDRWDRGTADGVEVGHVLALYNLGGTVRDTTSALDVDDQVLADVKLAVTEACTNVILHAYSDQDENGSVEVEVRPARRRVLVVVRDGGNLERHRHGHEHEAQQRRQHHAGPLGAGQHAVRVLHRRHRDVGPLHRRVRAALDEMDARH